MCTQRQCEADFFCFVISMGAYRCSKYLCMYLVEIKIEVAPP